jgi:hypothetical protein
VITGIINRDVQFADLFNYREFLSGRVKMVRIGYRHKINDLNIPALIIACCSSPIENNAQIHD